MESQVTTTKTNNIFVRIKNYYANQKVWLVIVLCIIALFTYGELTGTRFFFSEKIEKWKPDQKIRHRSYHSRVNHK